MKYTHNIIIITIILCVFSISNSFSQKRKVQEVKKDSISIFSKVNLLDEVVVIGKTVSRRLKESPLSIEVLSLTPLQNKGGDMVEILKRMPGVTLRSEGSVGDPINFNINGLDKKAIAIFKDGIPTSFYGHIFDVTHISSNMFERVEIYKGVLPLYLGADALGGGINFVSRKPKNSELNISTELSSYNTQRYGLNLYIPFSTGIYAGANVSYVASDNNWDIDVGREDPDKVGIYIYDGTVRAKLKNNGVNVYGGEYYVGIKNKKWADDLRLTFLNNWLYRGVNHIPGIQPLKKSANALFSFLEEKGNNGILSYKKSFFSNKLKTDLLLGYNKTNLSFKDTIEVVADRFGNIESFKYQHEYAGTERDAKELLGSDLDLEYTFKAARFNATYDIFPKHQLQFNHIYTQTKRVGTDPIGGKAYSVRGKNQGEIIDIYTFPATHEKSITAFGLKSKFFKNKLQTVFAYKLYRRRAEGYSTYDKDIRQRDLGVETSKNQGWMGGLSFKPTKKWLIKASYENTTRLPDDEEVFGNSQWIRSSFDLVPEESKNANLQLQYIGKERGVGAWKASLAGFYRKTTNYIALYSDIPFGYYKNIKDFGVLVKGIDFDFAYQPFKFFSFGMNGMYIEKKLRYKGEVAKDRIADVPPILGNMNASFYWNDWFQKGSHIEFYWYWNYVHRYNLTVTTATYKLFEDIPEKYRSNWTPISGKPYQITQTAGVSYTFAKPKVSVSVECKNIEDKLLYYDGVEGAGRTFYLKLRWSPDISKILKSNN